MDKSEVRVYRKKTKREVVTTTCEYNETLVTRIETGVYRKKGKLIVFFFKSHDDEIVPCVIDKSKYPVDSDDYGMVAMRSLFKAYGVATSKKKPRVGYTDPTTCVLRFIDELHEDEFSSMLTRDLRKGLYTTDFPKNERAGIKGIAYEVTDRIDDFCEPISVPFPEDDHVAGLIGIHLLNVNTKLEISDVPIELLPTEVRLRKIYKSKLEPAEEEEQVTEESTEESEEATEDTVEESSEEPEVTEESVDEVVPECDEKAVMETIDKFTVPNPYRPNGVDSRRHLLDSFIVDFVSVGNRIHFSNKKRSQEEIDSMTFRFTKPQYVYYNDGIFYVNFDKFMDDLKSVGADFDTAGNFINSIIAADPDFEFMMKGRSRYYVINAKTILSAFISPAELFSESWTISNISLLKIVESLLGATGDSTIGHVMLGDRGDGIMTVSKSDFLAFHNNVRHETFGITKKIPKIWFDVFTTGHDARYFCDEDNVNINLSELSPYFKFTQELGMKFPNYAHEMSFLNSITISSSET